MTFPPLHALILAAGAGTRMGGPKALLERAGVPLLTLHVERALALGAAHVSAIMRPEAADLLAPRLRSTANFSLVTARTDSQASSLAVLVRALAADAQREPARTLLLTPVDVLPCSESTYRALQHALDERVLAATPTFRARGGHPVLVRSAVLAPYLEGPLETQPTLREVLQRAGSRRARVEVDDATVLSDLDTPGDAAGYSLKLP